jgi:anaerobic ribonucleoside-triphosphate reductase
MLLGLRKEKSDGGDEAIMADGPTVRGLKDKCPRCGSTNIERMTRVTGFFSKVEGWNKGKVAELRDRRARDKRYFG